MKNNGLFLRCGFLIMLNGSISLGNAQDTMYRKYSFMLPVQESSSGYENQVTQYPEEIYQFTGKINDSCNIYLVIRSGYDSLDIKLDDFVVKRRSKEKGIVTYSLIKKSYPGTCTITVRTRKYCKYTIYAKGQL